MLEDKNKFKEADAEKMVELLNFIAKEAVFKDIDVQKTIKFYGLLSWAQGQLLSKIKDNILEVVAVHTPKPEPKKKAAKAKAE
jgi:hypothetical protein